MTTILFSESKTYETGFLKVDDLHTIYYEQSGNPRGTPVVLLHGGPGAAPTDAIKRFHDSHYYRLILLHQRGCGKSIPHAEIKQNTTDLLVSDLEKLRLHLAIEKWHVFGGSWGSTLALAYAQTHVKSVLSLILRGVFLCRKEEIDWFYENSSITYPDYFAQYESVVPPSERHNRVRAFHKLLNNPDPKVHIPAAKAWSIYEAQACTLEPNQPNVVKIMGDDNYAYAMARIENHYFVNNIFMPDNALLNRAHILKNIPTAIVHGRYDLVTPIKNAFDLKEAMPHAELTIVTKGAHAPFDPDMASALIKYTEKMKKITL